MPDSHGSNLRLAVLQDPPFAPLLPAPSPRHGPPATPGPPAPSRGGGARVPASDTSVLARTGARRLAHHAVTVLWVVVNATFWTWWLAPGQRGSTGMFIAATIPLAYLLTVLPSFFWFFVGRARRPVHRPAPRGMRVALITPCVPSHESIEIVARQLAALQTVRYPHDSWVLDEGDDPDVKALAAAFGVRHFTRKGVGRWNEPGPPFQAKTKAGNVNAWLDHVAEEGHDYDVFVQLDIDHIPAPDYLDRTLGHFDDPAVGWVQAPSVGANLDSWTARGLAEQDVILQGPLQMGFYGFTKTPFIIGSHTTYRTSAIREIGGYQPTRAEDHLDTVVLAAQGYRGVYVPEVIARGDGPTDLATYLGQQFAWAYSMVEILLRHTPRLMRSYSPRLAFQFLMAQTWYPMWSLSCAVLWVLPIVALLTGHAIADVELSRFLLASGAIVLTSTLMWWTTRDLFQPSGVTMSWRLLVLEAARWPIVLWAVINVLFRVKKPYMITPKGDKAHRVVPGRRLYGPYLLLAWASLAAAATAVAVGAEPSTQGYLVLVLFNATAALLLLAVALGLEVRGLRRRLGLAGLIRGRGPMLLGFAATAAAAVVVASAAWLPMTESVR